MKKNAYIYDEHLGKTEIRKNFYYNNELYSYIVNKITNHEMYTKHTPKGWVRVPATIDLELAFLNRKSRRLWWRFFLFIFLFTLSATIAEFEFINEKTLVFSFMVVVQRCRLTASRQQCRIFEKDKRIWKLKF